MTSIPPSPELPVIHITSTLEPTTISLQNPTSSDPITLKLSLRLSNSDTPITVYTALSFVSLQQTKYKTFYYLRDTRTNESLHSPQVHGLRVGGATISLDAEDQLLTIHPDKPVERKVQLGLFEQPPPTEELPEGTTLVDIDPNRLRSLCGIQLSRLDMGRKYRVCYRDLSGYGNGLDWWCEGDREEVERRFARDGRREFNVDLIKGMLPQGRPVLQWEGEMPEIEIVE